MVDSAAPQQSTPALPDHGLISTTEEAPNGRVVSAEHMPQLKKRGASQGDAQLIGSTVSDREIISALESSLFCSECGDS